MDDETARRICEWAPVWPAYLAINLVLLVLLGISLAFIEWSLDSQAFVISILALAVVLGSIVLFGGMLVWCRQYRGVRTVESSTQD
ncbi:hypothetical protein C475_21644 [Halosimplex carlsbadense 2-9-1]|uniref:Uncharacterized protein n=1 Tax=Halosimplex carlsbadense 2-9-1 TaxID=797114 RepID=M0C9N3_9EURY|nr:hypothetical protein [Halosimplex carlsbadense]ELZ19945.1 hypothetical protein C475_21644 [Halosimplex carlsbadense 2-9-1]